MASNETRRWVLVLDPPRVAGAAVDGAALIERVVVLGLTLPLRLALTAQAAGATALALGPGAPPELRAQLDDARLRLPFVDEHDAPDRLAFRSDSASVRVPANAVVHRATLAALAERAQSGEVSLLANDGREPGNAAWEAARNTAGVHGFDPLLVTDAESQRSAERALLRSLRKPQDGWTSRHLNRPLSLALTRWLVSTRVHPSQLSVAILGVGLGGAIIASWGTYPALVVGALLFQAQSVLDGCDGEMARITFRGSHLGEWLDTIGDDLTNYGFFAGAALGLYTTRGRALDLALGAVVVLSGLIGSGLEYRYLIRIGSGDLLRYPIGVGQTAAGTVRPTRLGRALDAVSPLFKRDTFVLLTLVGALLGALEIFLAIFAAGAVAVLLAVIRAELRMRKASAAG